RGGGHQLAVRLHRGGTAHRRAGRRAGARREGLPADRGGAGRGPPPGLPGGALCAADLRAGRVHWPLDRPPYVLETSVPGVFAAGDVRLDSMKRVASAVGEGAMAVHLVHRYLATVSGSWDARRGAAAAGDLRGPE